MNILSKISLLSIIPLIAFSTSKAYSNNLNEVNVTFKNGTNQKYIELVSIFTNAKIKQKTSDNTFTFINNDTYNYKNLISMINQVAYIDNYNSVLKNNKSKNYVDGVILVKYKPEVKNTDITKIDKKYNTKSVLFSKSLGLYKVQLPSSLSVEQAVKIFSKLPEVQYAEPDMIMTIMKKSDNLLNISFKDDLSQKVFENIFDLNCVGSYNNCNTLIKSDFNTQNVIDAFKLSPYILNIKQVK